MKKINSHHEKFIEEMITHGERARAYKAAYPGSKNKYMSGSAWRLLQDPEIAQRIEEGRRRIQQEAEELMIQQHYSDMLTTAKKRVLLAKIIHGEMKFEKPFKIKDEIQTKYLPATLPEILRAMELDNKFAKDLPSELQEEIEDEIYISERLFK